MTPGKGYETSKLEKKFRQFENPPKFKNDKNGRLSEQQLKAKIIYRTEAR